LYTIAIKKTIKNKHRGQA